MGYEYIARFEAFVIAMEIISVGLLGLLWGSFLNVCIYRLPIYRLVFYPSYSFCPGCGQRIYWYDNIPIVSYLILKGRCRKCRMSISPRYMLVEMLTAQPSELGREPCSSSSRWSATTTRCVTCDASKGFYASCNRATSAPPRWNMRARKRCSSRSRGSLTSSRAPSTLVPGRNARRYCRRCAPMKRCSCTASSLEVKHER